ncbi:MAG: SDR family oxidoreductase [Bacteroidetes bacterium]|nr:SDR family oxidoreductase [Bacteroidota bacterium]
MQSKVVVITGGGTGIGKACAATFLARGYRVVISGRRLDKLQEVITEFKGSSEHILAVQADVSVEEDSKRIIEETIVKFGRIDVLINNAGISMRALFDEMDLSVLKRLMDTNFWGAVYCTKYALPYLLEAKGSVVGISSIAGKKGLPGRTGYSASKFALEGFLETLRIENLKKDLHVLIVCPGFTASDIRISSLSADGSAQGESPREENKMMSAQTVAREITEAVIKRKRDLVLTFNGRLTVLMNKFFPSLMDKLVYKHMAKEPGSPFK